MSTIAPVVDSAPGVARSTTTRATSSGREPRLPFGSSTGAQPHRLHSTTAAESAGQHSRGRPGAQRKGCPMFTRRSTTHWSAPVRMATALVGGVAGLSFLVGCGEASVRETEPQPVSHKVTIDEEQVRRELIQFENRRAAWAKQYAESKAEGETDESADASRNINQREHLARKNGH